MAGPIRVRIALWAASFHLIAQSALGGPQAIERVQSWGYQLQARGEQPIDLGALAKSPFDLLVIDHADGKRPLSRAEVEQVKKRPDGSARIVLAYLSIGEAEDYRSYWDRSWAIHPPRFIARPNPSWPGNYKVRFWEPGWQKVVLYYLDRIVDAGFDGVYLDVVDAYEVFGREGPMPERKTAAQDMSALVRRIAEHARKTRGQRNFLVVPQNGAGILDELGNEGSALYLGAIDAIGAEDTFFDGDKPQNSAPALRALERFAKAKKPVLLIDYVTDPKKAQSFVAQAKKHGFVPYVGTRKLDRLVLPQP